jgi:16S rRNA (cytidine1402-2'-O)-methyltransferase
METSSTTLGQLYLVPTPLDFACAQQAPLQDVLPQQTLEVARRLQYWVCENAKSARAFLKRVNEVTPLSCPIQQIQIQELPHAVHKKGDHTGSFDASALLAPLLQGHDMGLLSEAGMPAVADPGSSVVRAAHELGARVVPLVGPTSLLLALAASGLSGQDFAFIGYLPQDAVQRSSKIRELESLALKTGQTQIFIETPYRNMVLLQALLQNLQNNTRLAVSSGLTLPQARSQSYLVKHWKQNPLSLDNAIPAVFAIGR